MGTIRICAVIDPDRLPKIEFPSLVEKSGKVLLLLSIAPFRALVPQTPPRSLNLRILSDLIYLLFSKDP